MNGKFDPRNQLNDLTGKEWLLLTKSFWTSQKSSEDKFAFQHPAPFLVKDIERLIKLFTKSGMRVLDPFCGVGTTLVASANLGRQGIGIELNPEYVELTNDRLIGNPESGRQTVIQGDSLVEVEKIPEGIDYCVTSPPYHNILRNKGAGIRAPKEGFRNGARSGTEYYSDEASDLGNQETFEEFLQLLQAIMLKVFEKLRPGAYATIVISDFTVDKKEVNVQGEIVRIMSQIGFTFEGTIVLLQESKPLYPFGYPYAYKINHHHQNLINFRRPKTS